MISKQFHLAPLAWPAQQATSSGWCRQLLGSRSRVSANRISQVGSARSLGQHLKVLADWPPDQPTERALPTQTRRSLRRKETNFQLVRRLLSSESSASSLCLSAKFVPNLERAYMSWRGGSLSVRKAAAQQLSLSAASSSSSCFSCSPERLGFLARGALKAANERERESEREKTIVDESCDLTRET